MSIEAMNQAFEVPLVEQLESVPTNARLVIDDADGMGTQYIPVGRMCHDASKALRQAIAEAEKQQRTWVGLTEEEIDTLESATDTLEFPQTVRAIEAKLKEKNL
jgi:hypothetical protein